MPDSKQQSPRSSSPRSAGATHGSSGSQSPLDELENQDDPLASAADWVRENQTLAMVGAFAVGTFIGALLRD